MSGQRQIQIPTHSLVADVFFSFGAIIYIDTRNYPKDESRPKGRLVRLCFIDGVTCDFEDEQADQAWIWYLTVTGQAKIIEPNAVIAPGSLGGQ